MEGSFDGGQTPLFRPAVQAMCSSHRGPPQNDQGNECKCLISQILVKPQSLTAFVQVHPIYKAYLAFYGAISYEFLGQAAHLYSNNKVTYLHAALDSFLDCLSVLPESTPLPKMPAVYPTPPPSPQSVSQTQSPETPDSLLGMLDDAEERSPQQPVIFDALTRMIDVSLGDQDVEDPFLSDSDNECPTQFVGTCRASDEASHGKLQHNGLIRVQLHQVGNGSKAKETVRKNHLVPSPLRFRKDACDLPPRNSGYPTMFDTPTKPGRSSPGPSPLSDIRPSPFKIDSSKLAARLAANKLAGCSSPSRIPRLVPKKLAPKKFAPKRNEHNREDKILGDEVTTPTRMAHIVKFNREIEFLRSQVKANISDVQKHVEKVTEIQRARRARKIQRQASFWTFSPVNPEEEAEVEPEPELIMDRFGNVLTKETKQQRIARLRADGWSTVGLRSPRSNWKGARYYQDFCNMVLMEMSVEN
jgi:hypothetical protein